MRFDLLLTQIRAAGLPEPEREIRVCPGRRWKWDYCWKDVRIAVEFQGGTWNNGGHVRGKQYRSDCEKMFEGQMRGFLVLWVTTDMVEDGSALALIERAFSCRKIPKKQQKKATSGL